MGTPLVSIVTATLNGKEYLEETILSVIGQDYANIEYIIVDGGSSDDSLDIIRHHEDKINRWISEPDRGTSDAMNKGARIATGEIIGFINSDDRYEPGAIRKVVDIFARYPNVGVVYGDLRYINFEKGETYIIHGRRDHEALKRLGILGWGRVPILLPTVFFRKKLFDRYGLFDLSYKLANDFEIFLRFIKNGVDFYCVPEVISVMRSGGMSDKQLSGTQREFIRVFEQYGYGKTAATLYYSARHIFDGIEDNTGRLLKTMGLTGIIRLYRSIVYPRIDKSGRL